MLSGAFGRRFFISPPFWGLPAMFFLVTFTEQVQEKFNDQNQTHEPENYAACSNLYKPLQLFRRLQQRSKKRYINGSFGQL